jgi:hypothetical protein
VRSAGWLDPCHFNGSWTRDRVIADIARRSGASAETIERSLAGMTAKLQANGMIVHELC